MDYERIILELMGRIQNLEDKVDSLLGEKESNVKASIKTSDICEYIKDVKSLAKGDGKTSLILIARDIHRQLGLKSRYPMVCNAMRQCMGENDRIIFQPPKGNSSTLKIEYML